MYSRLRQHKVTEHISSRTYHSKEGSYHAYKWWNKTPLQDALKMAVWAAETCRHAQNKVMLIIVVYWRKYLYMLYYLEVHHIFTFFIQMPWAETCVLNRPYINLLKPKTCFMYHRLWHSEILCSAHNAFFFFLWIAEQTATWRKSYFVQSQNTTKHKTKFITILQQHVSA